MYVTITPNQAIEVLNRVRGTERPVEFCVFNGMVLAMMVWRSVGQREWGRANPDKLERAGGAEFFNIKPRVCHADLLARADAACKRPLRQKQAA